VWRSKFVNFWWQVYIRDGDTLGVSYFDPQPIADVFFEVTSPRYYLNLLNQL